MAYNFYFIPITKSGSAYDAGAEIDIENHPSLNTDSATTRYKAITGMEAYGKPRPYVENYAESDMSVVEIQGDDPRDQTDISLTVLFLFSGLPSTAKDTQIKVTADIYHAFVSMISGKYILYYDTARQRKALLYQSDKIDPKTDNIKDVVYKEVEVKFKNVFGRSFPLEDNTIETALGFSSILTPII